MSVETMLFDQDYVTEMYEHELFEEGKKQGIEQGMQQGMQQGQVKILKALFDKGILTDKEFKKEMSLITT